MMNNRLSKLSCTGCGACINVCNVGAIKMIPQNDGFLYPVINEEKCLACSQCESVCHALGEKDFSNKSLCYAAKNKDDRVLRISSSGGLFFALASYVLEENGVVYGCVFDENYNAVITRAETYEQIQPMHGSKYVWSDSSHSFPSVKQDLESGRKVLYTSLPCQVAGLMKYLQKQYDNLYTVDVLCGGAASPYAFYKYISTLTDTEGRKKLDFQFRDKEKYGAGVDCTYVVNGKKHHENYLENSYYYAFSSKCRIIWRKSCYRCDYKSIRRVSDMTIGDFWGAEKFHSSFNPRDGISLVLVSSCKGEELFEHIKGKIEYEESDIKYAIEKNSLVNEVYEGYVEMPENRDAFFIILHSDGWNLVDKIFLKDRKRQLRKQKIVSTLSKVLCKLNFIIG